MEVTSYLSHRLPHACVCLCVHVYSWLISYAVWILQGLPLLSFPIERTKKHVSPSYLTLLATCSNTHRAHGGPWSAASTSLSCPHFSAFFEADLTPLLAGPAKGGQEAEQISHVSQALDHGLKLRRRFANCCFQAWSRQSEWALLPHPVIRLKMI